MERDSGLIFRLKKREEAAFNELYSREKTALYNYILCRLRGDEEGAGDVLAEVFSDAILYAGSLTPLHNVRAWLFRIAKSKIADHFRRLAREAKWHSGAPVEKVANGKGHGRDPAELVVNACEKAAVRAAFAELPDDHRQVLWRMYVLEESMKDIAAAFGKTEKAVESLLYRARKELEKSLAKNARTMHARRERGGGAEPVSKRDA